MILEIPQEDNVVNQEFNEEEIKTLIPPPSSTNSTVIPLAKLDLIDKPLTNRAKPDLSKYQHSSLECDNIISYGNHSFLSGILTAYRMHKSITFSPDIIWLLIVQGFTYHVGANKESLRSMFVNFEGKKELSVKRLNLTPLTAKKEDWIGIVDEFVEKIDKNTKENIAKVLEPKFSTTNKTSHTAGMISIMSAMKHYFDYKVYMCACGFPSIQIEGKIEDWELIKEKVLALSKYDLEWWTSKLIPILDEFIKAKKGEINREFWLKIIREKRYGDFYDPSYIDGWICTFFPYNKYGDKRRGCGRIYGESNLPSEILDTPFILEILGLEKSVKVNCQLDSGFMGIQETKYAPGVYNIKPIIGWGLLYDAPVKVKPTKPDDADYEFGEYEEEEW